MPNVKGGIQRLWTFLSIVWGADETGNSKEVNTIDDADPKTVSARAGLTISELEAKEYTEVYNGEDISGNADFQDKKYIQVKATLRGDSAQPILKNLIINATEALSSFIRMPNSRKVITTEIVVKEHISGFTNFGGYVKLANGTDYLLTTTGSKVVLA